MTAEIPTRTETQGTKGRAGREQVAGDGRPRRGHAGRAAAAAAAAEAGPAAPTLTENQVRLGYRLLLNRTPSAAEVAQMLSYAPTLPELRLAFLNSDEFAQNYARMKPERAARPPQSEALYHYYCEYDAVRLIASFARQGQVPEPEYIKNFLGVKIPPKVYPPLLDKLKGKVEPVPDPGNWHADIAEWAAALRSVAQARDGHYRIVELGCGWGCWLVNMGAAARARGLSVDLIGVEGDANHLANAREVLMLNGFSGDQFRLNHGIAAARPGKAIFPRPDQGTAAWGGKAIFYPDETVLAAAQDDPAVQVLDCLMLEALSGDKVIDLLHIDIQGAEVDYVRGNMGSIERLVRRVLIGTHSRIIEGQLSEHFLNAGWTMEMDRPVLATLQGGRPLTRIDGVQLWCNPGPGPDRAVGEMRDEQHG